MTTLAPPLARAPYRPSHIIPHRTCIKTEKRELGAIMVRLVASRYQAVCVWPDHEPEKPCCKLPDQAMSWLEAKAGDTILLWEAAKNLWVQRTIHSITLYRVFPVKYCNVVVTSAGEWLGGTNGTHKSVFGSLGDRLPCDTRGFVPTAETDAFDLQFDHIEDTHTVCGMLTGYGHWWQEYRWPQIVAEVFRLTQQGTSA
jgi:hypothetical protein